MPMCLGAPRGERGELDRQFFWGHGLILCSVRIQPRMVVRRLSGSSLLCKVCPLTRGAVSTAQRTKVIANCSFCGKPNHKVKKLIAGPGVYICNECIDLCNGLVDETVQSRPRMAPWEYELTLEQVLTSLGPVASAELQAQRNLTNWVMKARSLGATWAQVGDALDITRQSAWERFSWAEAE